MSTDRTVLADRIRREVRRRYPFFPVTVEESPDDSRLLCVRIFGVPKSEAKAVKAAIREIETALISDGRFLLLPMVKDEETTLRHYPEHSRFVLGRWLAQESSWRFFGSSSNENRWVVADSAVAYTSTTSAGVSKGIWEHFRQCLVGLFAPSKPPFSEVSSPLHVHHLLGSVSLNVGNVRPAARMQCPDDLNTADSTANEQLAMAA